MPDWVCLVLTAAYDAVLHMVWLPTKMITMHACADKTEDICDSTAWWSVVLGHVTLEHRPAT